MSKKYANVQFAYSPTKGWYEVSKERNRMGNEGGRNKFHVGTERQYKEVYFYDHKRF